jgi:hypothetical protein
MQIKHQSEIFVKESAGTPFARRNPTTNPVEAWFRARRASIPIRKVYEGYISEKDSPKMLSKWTDIVYVGLFGCNAEKIKLIWKTQAGRPDIARNHLPEALWLEAVSYCEELVVTIDLTNLWETHQEALRLTRKKYNLKRRTDLPDLR